MSGGHFDYKQHHIGEIADSVERQINKNGKPYTQEEIEDEYYFCDDPLDNCHYEYPEHIIKEFKQGLYFLRMAQIYSQRIDWLLSGDDGEECFIKRLKQDIDNYHKEKTNQ